MAHLWNQGEGGWGAQRLDGAEFDLAGFAFRRAPEGEPGATPGTVARLGRTDAAGLQVWALIASRDAMCA